MYCYKWPWLTVADLSIAGKLMDKLDIELANQEMFQPDEKGRLNSLTTVLTQEVERFNKLLKVIKVYEF